MQAMTTTGGGRVRHRRARHGSLMIGCLAALLLVIGIVAAGGIYLYLNARSLVADAGRQAVAAAVNESELPTDQKVRIIAEVDALAAEFEAGNVSFEDLQRVMEQLAEGPLLPLGAVYAVKENYLDPSELTDEEKAEGHLALNRFAQGVLAKKLGERDIEEVTAPLDKNALPNQWDLKEPDQVTPDELRELLATAKAKADEAGIPETMLEIDIAQEVSDAIDRALNPQESETVSQQEGSEGETDAPADSEAPVDSEEPGEPTEPTTETPDDESEGGG